MRAPRPGLGPLMLTMRALSWLGGRCGAEGSGGAWASINRGGGGTGGYRACLELELKGLT